MRDKIADFLRSRKGQDAALVVAVLLVGVISFGLGRLSNTPAGFRAPVTLYVPATTSAVAQVATYAQETAIERPRDQHEASPPLTQEKQYVASKNGSVYHLPWCSGAKRIKEENKVWFATKEEAEHDGYRPATNCKGI